jgi:crossover junction endodeoxyribonuclease RusA
MQPMSAHVSPECSAYGKPLKDFGRAPLCALLNFVLTRPKSAPKKSTPAAIRNPDLDKLQRAVFDAIKSAGVYQDDSQVVAVFAVKRIAELDNDPTGCLIRLIALRDGKL